MIQELADSIRTIENEDGTRTEPDPLKKKQFEDFYAKYHTNVKLGIIEDVANRTRLSKLLRYYSSKSPNDTTTLDEYVARMKPDQAEIYYLAGASRDLVEKSPHLEKLTAEGFEVMFCTDPIDEYALTHLDKFDGKFKIVNVSREGLKVPADEEKEKAEKEMFQPLSDFLKTTLGEKIDKAVPTRRLTTSPSALVAGASGYTANMERIMKAQAITAPHVGATIKKTLEYNARHPIVRELFERVKKNAKDPVAKDIALLMFDTAALTSGYQIDDAKDFASHINRMLSMSLGIDPNAPLEPEIELKKKMASDSTGSKDEL